MSLQSWEFLTLFLPRFVPLTETTSTLCLHSQSVYGYDDLGKNKQRVGDMLKALRDLPASMLKSTVTV